MGNPNFRSDRQKGKIGGLRGHANLPDSFEKTGGYGIPGTPTKCLQCPILSLEDVLAGADEGGNIGEFGDGEHVI